MSRGGGKHLLIAHHLHLDVGEVGAALRLRLEVALGHVVVAVVPVHVEEEVGVHLRHLLHPEALAHRAVRKGLALHLNHKQQENTHQSGVFAVETGLFALEKGRVCARDVFWFDLGDLAPP